MWKGHLRFGLLIGVLVGMVGHFTTRGSLQSSTLTAFWIALGAVVTLAITLAMERMSRVRTKTTIPETSETSGPHPVVRSDLRTTVSTTGKFFAITRTPSSSELKALMVDAPTLPGNPVTTRLKLIIEKYDHFARVPVDNDSLLTLPLPEVAGWSEQAAISKVPASITEARFSLVYLRSEGPLDEDGRSSFGWTFIFVDGALGVRASVTVTANEALVTYTTAVSYPKVVKSDWLDPAPAVRTLRQSTQRLADRNVYLRVNFPTYYYLYTRRPLAIYDIQALMNRQLPLGDASIEWSGANGIEPFMTVAQIIELLERECQTHARRQQRIAARVNGGDEGISATTNDPVTPEGAGRSTDGVLQPTALAPAEGPALTPLPPEPEAGEGKESDSREGPLAGSRAAPLAVESDGAPVPGSEAERQVEHEEALADIQLARDLHNHHEIVLRTTAKQLFDSNGPGVVHELTEAILRLDATQQPLCHTLLFLLAFLPSGMTLLPLADIAAKANPGTRALAQSLFDKRRKWELGIYPDPLEPLGFEESRALLGRTGSIRLALRSTYDPEGELLPPLSKAGLKATRIRLLSGDTELFMSASLMGDDNCTEGLLSSSPLPIPCNVLRVVGPASERLAQRVQASGVAYSRESIIADVLTRRPYDLHRGALYMAALSINEPSTFDALIEGVKCHRSNLELRRACLAALAQIDHPQVIPFLESLDSSDVLDLCTELLGNCKRRAVSGSRS